MKLLTDLVNDPLFNKIKLFLREDNFHLKRYQLSRSIAVLFDRYFIYRPEFVNTFSRAERCGEEIEWQLELMRRLILDTHDFDPQTMRHMLIQGLLSEQLPSSTLPSKLILFGISHLPEVQLKVFASLSKRIPIYYFLINPCRQFWTDIISENRINKIQLKVRNTDYFHYETGNKLLASWGKVGRFVIDHLIENEVLFSEELFEDNPNDTLLSRIQNDILNLDESLQRLSFKDNKYSHDDSLQVHICHSEMREIEILHSRLVPILDGENETEPRDIIVMAPDIEIYVPYINAVFGTIGKIPYKVIDQNNFQHNNAIDAFLQLLKLKKERHDCRVIFDVLSNDCIRMRFGFTEEDIIIIRDWVQTKKIRWGLDKTYLKSKNILQNTSPITLPLNLDRLIIGWAMNKEEVGCFDLILPAEIEDLGNGRIIGRLSYLVQSLNKKVSELPDSATVEEWYDLLSGLVEYFFIKSNTVINLLKPVTKIIYDFVSLAKTAGYRIDIPFELVLEYIQTEFSNKKMEYNVNINGVTFCSFSSLRCVPAQVVCLLGLQHDSFPRDNPHESSFNLLSLSPKAGDRPKREDDKYFFLEALLSARKVFYTSYVGKNITNNSEIPPSVIIDELMEYIREQYNTEKFNLMTTHSLHDFSMRNQRIITSTQDRYTNSGDAITDIGKLHKDIKELDLSQIIIFYSDPIRFYLLRRLGINLQIKQKQILSRENFDINPQTKNIINRVLLQKQVSGIAIDNEFIILNNIGTLPHGAIGEVLYKRIELRSKIINRLLNREIQVLKLKKIDVDFKIDNIQFLGEIDQVYHTWRFLGIQRKMNPYILLETFIKHLALCIKFDYEKEVKTTLISDDQIWEFTKIASAKHVLKEYIKHYWDGISTPIPFYMDLSFVFAQQVINRNSSWASALDMARKKWDGSHYAHGESENPYHSIINQNKDWINKNFAKISINIFKPILTSGIMYSNQFFAN
jgi:exodeoxyribonuclease V gamma subunit